MRRPIAFILLFCLHVQPGVNLSIWLDYLINNEYIKEVLCINKAEPELKCNGKCHLAKQLKKNELPAQNHNKLSGVKIFKIKYVAFSSLWPVGNTLFQSLNNAMSSYRLPFYKGIVVKVFHPPKISYSHKGK